MILRKGSSGPEVGAWQRFLGIDPPTDYFGAVTEAKTKEWQLAHGLLADGVVGPATVAASVGAPARVEGLDVSSANSRVNYQKVREAMRRYAYVRVNAGEGKPDALFMQHARGFSSNDMLVGGYHFALIDDDPDDDVDAFLTALGPAAALLRLPPALDVETLNGVDPKRAIEWLTRWVWRCRAALKKKPVIYTGPNFWQNILKGNDPFFKDYALWVSHYGANRPTVPAPWAAWKFWQYLANTIWLLPNGDHAWGPKQPHPDARIISRAGILDGVDGEVDLDVFNGSYADLEALCDEAA